MVSFRLLPLYPRGKNQLHPFSTRLVELQKRSGFLKYEEISCWCRESIHVPSSRLRECDDRNMSVVLTAVSVSDSDDFRANPFLSADCSHAVNLSVKSLRSVPLNEL
jgi:hypothetical protein